MIQLMNIIIVFLLVFLNGFFVAAEFAVVKVRKSRIETLVLDGHKGAKHTLTIINHLNSYLSACQLGITLASLGLGWVGEPAIAELLDPIFEMFDLSPVTVHSVSFIIAFTLISGLHIVLGELAPKSLAIINAEKISLMVAFPLILFYKLTYPIIWIFNRSTDLVLKVFGISQVDEHEAAHTDEEIKLLVEESYKHGLIDQTELTFVDNIFNFSETSVKEIMTPRTEMICIYDDTPYDEIIQIALQEELTRYPVCRESKDNIIGFIHSKDLFRQKLQEKEPTIETILRDTVFVPESMSISVLLKLLQKNKDQMAIIVDEYGGTAGLVTVEDILEEIVGEIQDEFDEEIDKIKKIDEDKYLVDGKVLLNDINKLLDIDIVSEDVDTLGGWIYSQLGVLPQVNQKVSYEDYEFIIHNFNNKRITKILIQKKEARE